MKNIQLDLTQINTLCKNHNVKELYLFGSVLSDNFREDSDVDILVKFLPIDLYDYFNNYISLKNALSQYFGREIDLLEEQSLKNPILMQSIDKNKRQIYG